MRDYKRLLMTIDPHGHGFFRRKIRALYAAGGVAPAPFERIRRFVPVHTENGVEGDHLRQFARQGAEELVQIAVGLDRLRDANQPREPFCEIHRPTYLSMPYFSIRSRRDRVKMRR